MWPRTTMAAVFLVAASMGLSLVHPWGDVRNVARDGGFLEGSKVPQPVRETLETKCADCHSNRTHWPVYSRIAPGSWLMEHDVYTGRSAMNLSRWGGMSGEDRISALTRIAAEVRSGEMPPAPYALMHPANRLTDEEKKAITAWAKDERKQIRATSNQQKGAGTQ